MNAIETQHELTGLRETARTLGLPPDWLRAEVDAGRVPCLRIRRKQFFNVSAVRAALARRAACETVRPAKGAEP